MAGRKPKADRADLLSRVIAVRLTQREGDALDAMVEAHNKNLRRMGLMPAITPASLARSCVIQAAVTAGLLPPLDGEASDDAEASPLVVVPPLRRADPSGPPLPPPTRFDRLDGDEGEPAKPRSKLQRASGDDDRFKKVLRGKVDPGRPSRPAKTGPKPRHNR